MRRGCKPRCPSTARILTMRAGEGCETSRHLYDAELPAGWRLRNLLEADFAYSCVVKEVSNFESPLENGVSRR